MQFLLDKHNEIDNSKYRYSADFIIDGDIILEDGYLGNAGDIHSVIKGSVYIVPGFAVVSGKIVNIIADSAIKVSKSNTSKVFALEHRPNINTDFWFTDISGNSITPEYTITPGLVTLSDTLDCFLWYAPDGIDIIVKKIQ